MDPQDLLGHTWEVVEIDGEPVTLQQPPAVEFTTDGRVVGNTGANRLMGGYELMGERMRVSQLATTMMAGRPEAMRTETRLVQALGAGGDVEIQLVMHNAYSGNSLRLRRIGQTERPPADQPAGATSSEADAEPASEPSASSEADGAASPPPPEPGDTDASNGVSHADAEPASTEPIVRGRVLYRERIAMPEGSVVTVRLLDTSPVDGPAQVIGEQVIADPPNVPVSFEIGYEPSAIDAGRSYAIAAQIEVNGQLAWRSTMNHPVLTRGAGASAVVMVTRAS
jgi:putative lipoprotein